ncbi:hypothetical protein [Microscilla marina]|uniref:Uncharacterized protein n=1 Tax=Microscilla marina ATCC 23134 TaxID=313606 RepID=A1ZEJ3_MICM2|nr:hypothetical protein [Microscilla marina]EAY30945.1 hypothetical protein M23134_07352 [Microscilla marina ATCC 23134]
MTIDWNKFVRWLVPSYLKKEQARHLAWLQVMLTPIKTLYEQFVAFRVATQLEIAISNQTMVLEEELNRRLGLSQEVVIINQTYQRNRRYIYYLSEASSLQYYRYSLNEITQRNLLPKFSYTLGEFQGEFDFVVQAPALTADQQLHVSAFIDKYKLPDKTYTIIIKE